MLAQWQMCVFLKKGCRHFRPLIIAKPFLEKRRAAALSKKKKRMKMTATFFRFRKYILWSAIAVWSKSVKLMHTSPERRSQLFASQRKQSALKKFRPSFYRKSLSDLFFIFQLREKKYLEWSSDSRIEKVKTSDSLFRCEELSNATGRLVGRSLDCELGILKPPSVGDGVETLDPAPGGSSVGGLGLAELAVPPEG